MAVSSTPRRGTALSSRTALPRAPRPTRFSRSIPPPPTHRGRGRSRRLRSPRRGRRAAPAHPADAPLQRRRGGRHRRVGRGAERDVQRVRRPSVRTQRRAADLLRGAEVLRPCDVAAWRCRVILALSCARFVAGARAPLDRRARAGPVEADERRHLVVAWHVVVVGAGGEQQRGHKRERHRPASPMTRRGRGRWWRRRRAARPDGSGRRRSTGTRTRWPASSSGSVSASGCSQRR